MFAIEQIFIDDYPEEAATFCNANNLLIAEIEPENGHRRFQIQEISIPEPTEEEQKQLRINNIHSRLEELRYVSEEIALGLASKEDYADEIEEIAELHNELYMLEEE